jgi:hypothetical protein
MFGDAKFSGTLAQKMHPSLRNPRLHPALGQLPSSPLGEAGACAASKNWSVKRKRDALGKQNKEVDTSLGRVSRCSLEFSDALKNGHI